MADVRRDFNDAQVLCSGPEFVVGVITGVRMFCVNNFGQIISLHRNKNRQWPPGEKVAVCNLNSVRAYMNYENCEPSDVPNAWCTCGIYAYHDSGNCIFELDQYPVGRMKVALGVIDGYGRTVIGTSGFRCEKARIRALLVPPATIERETSRRRRKTRPRTVRDWYEYPGAPGALTLYDDDLRLNALRRLYPDVRIYAEVAEMIEREHTWRFDADTVAAAGDTLFWDDV